MSNELIDFSESIWIFSIFFFTFLKIFVKILKNERNVTNFEYDFVPGFHITQKNFSGDIELTFARL